jgi:hypothetical protein
MASFSEEKKDLSTILYKPRTIGHLELKLLQSNHFAGDNFSLSFAVRLFPGASESAL